MAENPTTTPAIDCVERYERAIGLDGERADVERMNNEVLQMLREIASTDYVEALEAGQDVAAMLPDATHELHIRTRIQQLADRYLSNKAISTKYAQERAAVLADPATGADACTIDSLPDEHELDMRLGTLVDAKFRELVMDLASRATVKNEFFIYRGFDEGDGYELFDRDPTSEDSIDPKGEYPYDALFFPADTRGREDGIYDDWGEVNGYLFARPTPTGEGASWDPAAVERFLRMTPDDVLRQAEEGLKPLREADARNKKNLADARALETELQNDPSADFSLSVLSDGSIALFLKEIDPALATNDPLGDHYLGELAVPSWRVEDGRLVARNPENQITRAYIEKVAADMRAKKQKR